MTDYYKVLGVDKTATEEQIKDAWKSKIKEHHPDIGGDEEKAKEINIAYKVLSDPQERAAYDNPRPNVPPGFNPFMAGGFNIHDIFAKMGGASFSFGGPQGHVFSQQIISINVEMSVQQMFLGGELETDSPAGRIKFTLPPMTLPGRVFPINVNQNNNPNQQLIIQVKLVLKLPNELTEEQKKKIQELGL